METEQNIRCLLEQIPHPVFLVKDGIITAVNPAASALLLSAGDPIAPLLAESGEEYAAFCTGQLYLGLTIGGTVRSAAVTRMEGRDLFLLDPESDGEEFRSMALVSMELRGPLSRLMSSAEELLRSQGLTGEHATQEAMQLNRSMMQLMRLVCNLSDVSHYATAARMELRDVDSFLSEIFEKAALLTAGRNIRLTYTGPDQQVFSLIDPELLERSIWNMISNAVKFTPQGGSIQARLTRCGARLRLCLTDSGSGIAEAVRSDLFRRYLRQPGIEDSRFGLGLGMVLMRTTAIQHGGTLLVDQPREGGTRITMTLAIRESADTLLRSPVLLPDYSGGRDHGLLELSDCLPEDFYRDI